MNGCRSDVSPVNISEPERCELTKVEMTKDRVDHKPFIQDCSCSFSQSGKSYSPFLRKNNKQTEKTNSIKKKKKKKKKQQQQQQNTSIVGKSRFQVL